MIDTIIKMLQKILKYLPIIISTLSLIISVFTVKKQKIIKLRENYYEPVFKEILTKDFPNVFTNFVDINKKIIYKEQSTPFEELLTNFRKKIKYLMFTDEKIFNKLNNLIIEIDELIIILCTKEENKEKNIDNISKQSKLLYKYINDYFSKIIVK